MPEVVNVFTVGDTLRTTAKRLDVAQVDAPATTARLLLSEVLGKPKAWLVAHGDEAIDTPTRQHFEALLRRVIAHEPLFYVLGHREFYGLDLIVDRRVLIPRPETEMLVELALAELEQSRIHESEYSILDVGTGSGAVPIAIAAHAPDARVLATDVSAGALAVARKNAERHGVADRIAFVRADLLAGVEAAPVVFTANLPYVTREEIDGLPPEIQDHEPRVALDGGEDGLDLVRRLLRQIADRVEVCEGGPRHSGPRHGAALRAAFLEIGASQGPAALAAARAILPGAHSEIRKDLAQLDRVLVVRFPTAGN